MCCVLILMQADKIRGWSTSLMRMAWRCIGRTRMEHLTISALSMILKRLNSRTGFTNGISRCLGTNAPTLILKRPSKADGVVDFTNPLQRKARLPHDSEKTVHGRYCIEFLQQCEKMIRFRAIVTKDRLP